MTAVISSPAASLTQTNRLIRRYRQLRRMS
jgi:hypothetical protein